MAAFLALVGMIGIIGYSVHLKESLPEHPEPITQEWIKEDVVCYYQGERVINCESVRFE